MSIRRSCWSLCSGALRGRSCQGASEGSAQELLKALLRSSALSIMLRSCYRRPRRERRVLVALKALEALALTKCSTGFPKLTDVPCRLGSALLLVSGYY